MRFLRCVAPFIVRQSTMKHLWSMVSSHILHSWARKSKSTLGAALCSLRSKYQIHVLERFTWG